MVAQMEAEGTQLRTAKQALEDALSRGQPLSDATVALDNANKAYQAASGLVRKNCSQPKAKGKAKAKAKAAA